MVSGAHLIYRERSQGLPQRSLQHQSEFSWQDESAPGLAFRDENKRIELVRMESLFAPSVSEDSAVAVGSYRFQPGVRQ